MTTPYYADESVTLWHGDALVVLREMPEASVDCVVTSPPYFGLRDYGVEGQQGAEDTVAEYVAGMVAVFAEVRRVLAVDGTCWLNLGDSYTGSWGAQGRTGELSERSVISAQQIANAQRKASRTGSRRPGEPPEKNLRGIPWRVAFALQDDGWWLRNDIIWAKPNGMPESIADRLSTKHEHVFLLTKSARYWFDLDRIREEHATAERKGSRRSYPPGSTSSMSAVGDHQAMTGAFAGLPLNEAGRNPGDVWTMPTQPFPGAHFATMPLTLAERCVLAGCKPGGTVLDPYSGSGTTGLAATKHGRRYVGIDLNVEYLDLSLRTRLAQTALIEEPA